MSAMLEERKATTSMRQMGIDIIRPQSRRQRLYKLATPSCASRTSGRAKTFLMVFMGHSGSSAIMSELHSHPSILIENPEAVDHPPFQFNSSLALQFTRDFFDKGLRAGVTPGFKIRPWHIMNSPKAWHDLVDEYSTRIIWQYRENNVKQTVGEYSYRYLNDSHILEGLRSEDEVKNRCKIGVGCSFAIKDFDFFHEMLKDSLKSDKLILEAASILSNDCVHEVRYEDYLYNRQGSMMDVYKFLGIDEDHESEPSRYKATGDNMCEVVSNWKELCRNFYGCKVWRHLFEDEVNGCGCQFSSSPMKYCDATMS